MDFMSLGLLSVIGTTFSSPLDVLKHLLYHHIPCAGYCKLSSEVGNHIHIRGGKNNGMLEYAKKTTIRRCQSHRNRNQDTHIVGTMEPITYPYLYRLPTSGDDRAYAPPPRGYDHGRYGTPPLDDPAPYYTNALLQVLTVIARSEWKPKHTA